MIVCSNEIKNLNIFILGPGFTKTKTHFETLKAGKLAGKNFKRVKNFLKSKQTGTTFKEIFTIFKNITPHKKRRCSYKKSP